MIVWAVAELNTKRTTRLFYLRLFHGNQEASLHNIILTVVIQQGFGRADHSQTVRLLKKHFLTK